MVEASILVLGPVEILFVNRMMFRLPFSFFMYKPVSN